MRGGKREGAGRKTGTKNAGTITKEAAALEYGAFVRETMRPLFNSQLSLARGVSYVYRIDKHKTKGEPTRIEHVLLEDAHEIADALDIIANGDQNGDFETGSGFYYITTHKPENQAINSLLERGLGKVPQPIAGDKDNPLEVVTIIKYAKDGGKPSA